MKRTAREIRAWGYRLLRDVVAESPIVIAITIATAIAAHAGWFDTFETAWLDAFRELLPGRSADDVFVVEVTDDDYEHLFQSTSPLHLPTLRNALAAIARGRPALVLIDLDTSPEAIVKLPRDPGDPTSWPPTVWAESDEGSRDALRGIAHSPGVSTGVARFVVDRDGIIRRHRRQFAPTDGGTIPSDSLPWKAVRIHCALGGTESVCEHIQHAAETDEDLLLNFAGDRFDYHRSDMASVLRASTGPAWGTEQGPLFGKIVLVGATFRAAKDLHATPLGLTHGEYIIAQAIESELQGRGIRQFNEWAMVGMDLFVGFTIVLLHRSGLPLTIAFRASLLGLPVLVLVSSFVAFFSFSRWASFVPVCVGVMLHELHNAAGSHRHDRSEPERQPASTADAAERQDAASADASVTHVPVNRSSP